MEERNGAVQTTVREDTLGKDSVSYFALEGILNHFTEANKRLVRVIIVVLVFWMLTIAGFLWYVSLPVEDYNSVDIENDSGNANYIGNDMNGDFNYGESEKN